ncbi:cysteine hydrolase family protein [Brevibacillus daliensis]|uniref:cysteine hydrolase family protein n=1 Tax=Brevibacillus daliensis TaxID=2892995 RepID=UPI001E2BC1ED|nr:cysteine hydrolase family protein [Brevibacillus daliensis]
MHKPALVVIDVQQAMFEESDPVYQGESLLANIKQLLQQARANDVPVIYVQHNSPAGTPFEPGTHGWEIHPDLAPEENDVFIQKKTADSFCQTELLIDLNKLGISHLFLCGIQTEICVDTACRRAFGLGYKVTVVTDAHSTFDTEELSAAQIISHHNQIFKFFGETKRTDEISFASKVVR